MPRSSKATEGAARAGFTLIEALVALAVAAAALPTLSASFATAWSRARAAEETMAAMTLARALVADALSRPGLPAQSGKAGGFALAVSTAPLAIEPRRSALPPPLPETRPKPPRPDRGGAQPRILLRRVVVNVLAPSGRRLLLETAKAQPPPRLSAPQ